MIQELRTLQRVIRVFSEVRTGSVSEIKVHDISASDPIFFFGIDPLTVAMFGGVVTWALAQWKTVEEIRKIRTETKKLSAFTAPEVKEFFDSKIEGVVTAAVQKEAKALLKGSPLDQERKNELGGELEWALKALFARIERGLKVEIRFSLPEPGEGETEPKEQTKLRQDLQQVKNDLVFPKIESSPVLSLPSVKDADPYKPAKKRRQASNATSTVSKDQSN